MLDASGHIKLVDFGFAKACNNRCVCCDDGKFFFFFFLIFVLNTFLHVLFQQHVHNVSQFSIYINIMTNSRDNFLYLFLFLFGMKPF